MLLSLGSRRRIMENTRQRLIDTAGQIFGEKGYAATTVRDICQAAETNVAAVNYHFGDKRQLYLESVKQACTARAAEIPMRRWSDDTPPETRLREFIEVMISRMVDYPGPSWHLQLMMREMTAPTEACGELVRDFIRPHFLLLAEILGGLTPADAPAADLHLTAFSIIGQCVYHRLARPVIAELVGAEELGTFTRGRLAEHIANFSLAALGVSPARASASALQ